MMVDTSERPYSFKLIAGNIFFKTQIYDSKSRSWSATSSKLLKFAMDPIDEFKSCSCMCHNGCVYMSLGLRIILVYSMEEDSWTTLDSPPEFVRTDRNILGVLDGRISTTRLDDEEYMVSMLELVDRKKQEWAEYAYCSEDEYHQLMVYDSEKYGPDLLEDKQLMSFFCDEYLWVCNWQYHKNRADGLLMFNLKLKKWELVDLPMGTLSTADKQDVVIGDKEMEPDDEDDVDDVDEVDDLDEHGGVDYVDDV